MRTAKQVYFSTVTRAAAQRYDAIIATSSADCQLLGRLRPDVVLIPNGVAPLQCKAQGRHVLSHGRLATHKRLDLVIDAMAEPALADIQLHIVGPAWDVSEASLREHAERRGVSDRVHVHGGVSHEQLLAIAETCSVFASASMYEGFGMALVEAMSAGLAPVVAPNASFTEIMRDAPVGELASFHQPSRAAAAIRTQLDAGSDTRRDAARVFASRYSWSANAARTLDIYAAAQAKRPGLAAA
jgi:alpha-1,3-mannosyltransferase